MLLICTLIRKKFMENKCTVIKVLPNKVMWFSSQVYKVTLPCSLEVHAETTVTLNILGIIFFFKCPWLVSSVFD